MGLRERNGKIHYRFTINGHEFTGSCGLAATKRNESKAWRKETKARELVLQGRADDGSRKSTAEQQEQPRERVQ